MKFVKLCYQCKGGDGRIHTKPSKFGHHHTCRRCKALQSSYLQHICTRQILCKFVFSTYLSWLFCACANSPGPDKEPSLKTLNYPPSLQIVKEPIPFVYFDCTTYTGKVSSGYHQTGFKGISHSRHPVVHVAQCTSQNCRTQPVHSIGNWVLYSFDRVLWLKVT